MLDQLNRHDLTDEQWERLRVFLPADPPGGGRWWADHGRVIDGIFFRTRAGCPWRDLPEEYRSYLRKRGIKAVIPVKEDQKNTAATAAAKAAARPPAFDREQYKERNTVERCFGKLKQFRAVATRYDKRQFMCQGTASLASLRIWLRDPVP